MLLISLILNYRITVQWDHFSTTFSIFSAFKKHIYANIICTFNVLWLGQPSVQRTTFFKARKSLLKHRIVKILHLGIKAVNNVDNLAWGSYSYGVG